ncbi:MAG: endonuclease V [Candidatus Pacearchaeota archaeon]|nr:endonuclease V [Candidatus Pacearchaeota archaeon]
MKEEEAIKKGINIEALKEEQRKLAKEVSLKDAFDFKNATRFGGVHVEILQETREILATAVVCNENLEPIEEKYAIRPIRFPYIPGFRAYRELPALTIAIGKLEEQPDFVFIEAQGIAHPRGLGLASHLGIVLNKPTIGLSKSVLVGEHVGDEVVFNKKTVAKAIVTKQGAKPVYVSPGHMISLKTAIEMTKKCIKEPHKLPEPVVLARKAADRIKRELGKK